MQTEDALKARKSSSCPSPSKNTNMVNLGISRASREFSSSEMRSVSGGVIAVELRLGRAFLFRELGLCSLKLRHQNDTTQ